MGVGVIRRDGDCLSVGHLRLSHLRVDLELALQTIDDDLKMQLPHALDDGLVPLVIAAETERGILSCKLHQSRVHLVDLRLRLCLTGHLDDRLGEVHLLQHDLIIHGAQGVSRGRVLEPDDRNDVTCARGLDLLTGVGVHEHHASKTLLRLRARVVEGVSRLHHAGVDAEEGQGAHVGVVGNLEGEAGERGLVNTLPFQRLLLVLGVLALNWREVSGRGQVVQDCVQQRLHALVLEGSATQDWHEGHADASLPNALLQHLLRRLLTGLQISFQHLLVLLHCILDQLLPILLDEVLHALRDVVRHLKFGSHLLALPDYRLHCDEVIEALIRLRLANRKLDGHGFAAQLRHHHLHVLVEISTCSVHFVDEAHSRHLVLVGLAPDGLTLRLDPRNTIEDCNRTVEHAQRPLHLQGEVYVSWRVDDVDAVILPKARGGRTRDGDAALALLLHPVHDGLALMHLADLVRAASVVEDALCCGRLPRIDVCHDTNVPVLRQGDVLSSAHLLELIQCGHAHGHASPMCLARARALCTSRSDRDP
mmetsp:Transcript_67250/g.146582  ORF Transcript_67250/g.146582 Transcript_67250/m.146582 type:complete len:536 (+) Transcript_67250:681-2288(+)